MSTYSRFPLGTILSYNPNHNDGEGCPTIDKQFLLFTSCPSILDLKRIRFDIIDHVKTHVQDEFGSLNNFIITQLENAELSDVVRNFLLDSYRFIQTGKRRIDILSYPYLINEDSKLDNRYTDYKGKYQAEIEQLKRDEPVYLSDWLKHDDGFHDMIWSMKLLFGNIDNTYLSVF